MSPKYPRPPVVFAFLTNLKNNEVLDGADWGAMAADLGPVYSAAWVRHSFHAWLPLLRTREEFRDDEKTFWGTVIYHLPAKAYTGLHKDRIMLTLGKDKWGAAEQRWWRVRDELVKQRASGDGCGLGRGAHSRNYRRSSAAVATAETASAEMSTVANLKVESATTMLTVPTANMGTAPMANMTMASTDIPQAAPMAITQTAPTTIDTHVPAVPTPVDTGLFVSANEGIDWSEFVI